MRTQKTRSELTITLTRDDIESMLDLDSSGQAWRLDGGMMVYGNVPEYILLLSRPEDDDEIPGLTRYPRLGE